MDEGQQFDAGVAGDLRRLARRRVPGGGGALALLVGEARVVDEQLGAVGGGERRAAGCRVAGDDDPPPAPRLPYHLPRAHDRSVRSLHLLSALEPPEVGTVGDPEPRRRLGVEVTGPIVLDQRVAVGAGAVLDRIALDPVAVVLDRLTGLELDEVDLVRQPAEEQSQRLEQLDQAGWAEDLERPLAVVERVRLQQAREPEEVVGVKVGDEDVVDRHQPGRPLHLALRPLAAVEQQPVTAGADRAGTRSSAERSAPSPRFRERRRRGPCELSYRTRGHVANKA